MPCKDACIICLTENFREGPRVYMACLCLLTTAAKAPFSPFFSHRGQVGCQGARVSYDHLLPKKESVSRLLRRETDYYGLVFANVQYSALRHQKSVTVLRLAILRSKSSLEPTISLSYSRNPVPAGIRCPQITFSFMPSR